MVLTDWKKKSKSLYVMKKYPQVIIQIYKVGIWKKPNIIKSVWQVSGALNTKRFKTKSQALRFAKSYMRKH